MKKLLLLLLAAMALLLLAGCGAGNAPPVNASGRGKDHAAGDIAASTAQAATARPVSGMPEGFVLVRGGTFPMGSPENEPWRCNDELLHNVTVSDFYLASHEVTQAEYTAVMGKNPSNFSGGNLPVENISWLDAVAYCNARSSREGLTPAYQIEGMQVSWDRGANGYRLPTEAEWEYACRAGTVTPFNMRESPSAEEANYYGHYPYQIEDHYFAQDNLKVRPGKYRQTTVPVGSFAANPLGLYDMYGNVSEWVWDAYAAYSAAPQHNPTGAANGRQHVYRGGSWNDFAKHMRSAYRAMLDLEKSSASIGMRLAMNAAAVAGVVRTEAVETIPVKNNKKVLIAFFSWSGNTRGIAQAIQRQTGADLLEITMLHPYTTDYHGVLEGAQRDQKIQARPPLATHVADMGQYDTILLGYPTWWASIPMPVASFLEEYNFAGKTIVPFCSHGGGSFGQSLTAIAKLVPQSRMGEGLSVHYGGGSDLNEHISAWLKRNGIVAK